MFLSGNRIFVKMVFIKYKRNKEASALICLCKREWLSSDLYLLQLLQKVQFVTLYFSVLILTYVNGDWQGLNLDYRLWTNRLLNNSVPGDLSDWIELHMQLKHLLNCKQSFHWMFKYYSPKSILKENENGHVYIIPLKFWIVSWVVGSSSCLVKWMKSSFTIILIPWHLWCNKYSEESTEIMII